MHAAETRLGPALEVRFSSSDQGVFTGLASTFGGPPDSYGDVLAPGAFTATLAEHKARSTTPALLWSHNAAEPVGKWTSLQETAQGLAVTGKLTLGTPRGSDAYALLKDDVLGLSIGFSTKQATRDRAGNRVLERVDLIEISLVAVPANARARVTGVKSASDVRDARTFEEMLRDLGFPRSLAVGITAKGWAAAARRGEPEPAAIAELIRAIERRTAQLGDSHGS